MTCVYRKSPEKCGSPQKGLLAWLHQHTYPLVQQCHLPIKMPSDKSCQFNRCSNKTADLYWIDWNYNGREWWIGLYCCNLIEIVDAKAALNLRRDVLNEQWKHLKSMDRFNLMLPYFWHWFSNRSFSLPFTWCWHINVYIYIYILATSTSYREQIN